VCCLAAILVLVALVFGSKPAYASTASFSLAHSLDARNPSVLQVVGMKTIGVRFEQFTNFTWMTGKRIGQHVEWTGVVSFFGFVTLGTALLRDYPIWFPISMAIIGMALVLLAAHNSYTQKSMTLRDKYEERFFERMESKRRSAAEFLLGGKTGSDELEDVLDYFESPIAGNVILGSVNGKQVYDVFYHWIRLYWQASEAFINDYRQEEGQEAAYSNLKTLYEMTSAIEKREKEKKLKRPVADSELILKPKTLRKHLLQEAGKQAEVEPSDGVNDDEQDTS
jgi:hypothetical protein